MYWTTVTLCLALVACIDGAKYICCGPDQYEAFAFDSDSAVVFKSDKRTDGSNGVFLVVDNERGRTYTEGFDDDVDDHEHDFQTLLVWKGDRARYVIEDGKCFKLAIGKLVGESISSCVPDDARDLGIGSIEDTAVHAYEAHYEDPSVPDSLVLSLVVTEDNCHPVYRGAIGEDAGTHFVYATMFTNVTAGIRDPSKLEIPDICKDAEVVDAAGPTLGFHPDVPFGSWKKKASGGI